MGDFQVRTKTHKNTLIFGPYAVVFIAEYFLRVSLTPHRSGCLIGHFLSPSFVIGCFPRLLEPSWECLRLACLLLKARPWSIDALPVTCVSCHVCLWSRALPGRDCPSGNNHMLLVDICRLFQVTWGNCPLVAACGFCRHSNQLTDSSDWSQTFLRCNCFICFLGFYLVILPRWFHVPDFLLRQNLPATKGHGENRTNEHSHNRHRHLPLNYVHVTTVAELNVMVVLNKSEIFGILIQSKIFLQ